MSDLVMAALCLALALVLGVVARQADDDEDGT